MDVAEVTFCNSISVSEHVVMQILSLVRNYIPSYQAIKDGGWNIADCVSQVPRQSGRMPPAWLTLGGTLRLAAAMTSKG